MLSERVNIHAFASVRFNEPVNVAVGMIAVGKQQLLKLCLSMSQLKVCEGGWRYVGINLI